MDSDNLEGFLQDATRLNTGNDSAVYKSNLGNYVIKIYSNLRLTPKKCFDIEECHEMIERYNSDTLEAKKIIDTQWNNFHNNTKNITLLGKNYEVNITIAPQGETKIIGGEVLSVGQEYFEGLNLKQIFERSKKISGFEDFYNALNEQTTRICQIIESATKLINNTIEAPTGTLFETKFGKIDNTNIKPIINESERTLNLIITDLSTSIAMDYAVSFLK
jgi:hypothetical protein